MTIYPVVIHRVNNLLEVLLAVLGDFAPGQRDHFADQFHRGFLSEIVFYLLDKSWVMLEKPVVKHEQDLPDDPLLARFPKESPERVIADIKKAGRKKDLILKPYIENLS